MNGHPFPGPEAGHILSQAFRASDRGAGARTTVVLADQQAVLRDAVAAVLQTHEGVDIVGSTGDGQECVRMGQDERPDLLIFDTAVAGMSGLEVARRIARDSPGTRMLCLSAREQAHWVRAAFDAGAHGYVAKRNTFDVLARAIDGVMHSGSYVSPDVAHVLVNSFRGRPVHPGASGDELSNREREVARLYAEGLATREIADRLHLSMKTVGTHRDHVMAKLGIRGIAQLTRYAVREGLVDVDD
ncbi:transcriptional regulator [Luteibacter sp. OK325]|nr:transcriptional regulator [Luteibacter sp. OK325]